MDVSQAFHPSLILLGLSVPELNLCVVTPVASLPCLILTDVGFLCFCLPCFCSSHRNLVRCTDNSSWYFSSLWSRSRSGIHRWKDSLGMAPPAWGRSVLIPWIRTLGGAETRVTKESLGSVMLITDYLHFSGASQVTILIITMNVWCFQCF